MLKVNEVNENEKRCLRVHVTKMFLWLIIISSSSSSRNSSINCITYFITLLFIYFYFKPKEQNFCMVIIS